MKFSAIVLSALGFAALSLADTTSSAATPTQTSSYPTGVVSCLDKCSAADVTCQANCLGSAAPDDGAVNRTHDCVEKCDKGDGSEAATTKYGNCVTSCINTIYLSSATSGPTGTGSGSGSGSNPTATSGSGASHTSSGASHTSSGASASSTGNSGAGSVKVGGSFLALFGMAAGILAL